MDLPALFDEEIGIDGGTCGAQGTKQEEQAGAPPDKAERSSHGLRSSWRRIATHCSVQTAVVAAIAPAHAAPAATPKGLGERCAAPAPVCPPALHLPHMLSSARLAS